MLFALDGVQLRQRSRAAGRGRAGPGDERLAARPRWHAVGGAGGAGQPPGVQWGVRLEHRADLQGRALLGCVEWNWGTDATLGADGQWTMDHPGTRKTTSIVTNKNTPGKPLVIPPEHVNVPPDPNIWK